MFSQNWSDTARAFIYYVEDEKNSLEKLES